MEQAIYVQIAQLTHEEMGELLNSIGVCAEGVSTDQLRDTLTYHVETGEISLPE